MMCAAMSRLHSRLGERRHVATGVGDEQDLVVLLGNEPFDEHVPRAGRGLPVDIPDVVAGNIRAKVVEFHAACMQ
jgi:Holliday junction resolvase